MMRARQLLLDLTIKPNYARADFVESPCNWEAMQWVQRWPDWPSKIIAIYGEPGCGKTHLAHIWQAQAHARFLTPMDITDLTPLDVLKGHQAFVLDDADTLLGKEGEEDTESWMFHFYNLAREKGAWLLMCGIQPPTQWAVKLPDLKSRLAAILSVAVTPPDEETLQAVLFKLCSELGLALSPDVANYLLRRVERSFASVRAVVDILNQNALSQHRQLTLGLVREVLSGMNYKENRHPGA